MKAKETIPASLAQRFTDLAVIGSGGMGHVYEAFDVEREKKVALKLMNAKCCYDSNMRSRFQREADALRAISHPNVVSFYDFGLSGLCLWLTMELAEGFRLSCIVGTEELSVERSTTIAIDLLKGLAACHEAGMAHRDIKTDNVLVLIDGTVKLIDFGLALFCDATRITRLGESVGTIVCMAPEQINGQDTDARTDIYQVGLLLYEMLVGDLPHPEIASSYERAVTRILSGVVLPREVASENEALAAIVQRACAQDPGERYQSAQEMIKALEGTMVRETGARGSLIGTT